VIETLAPPGASGGPTLSVVIPAYHSARTLGACLRALERQTRRPDEVIVVNSSRDDATVEVASQFPSVRFFQEDERCLPHEARNRGAARASGDLLVFTDPDCEADVYWLESLAEAHRRGAQALGGAMDVVSSRSWREIGIHLVKFPHALRGAPAGVLGIASTANAAYSRSIFEAAGPFRGELFSGDAFLSRRVRSLGLPIAFVPEAVVRHVHGQTLAGLWRERLERGCEFARAIAEERHLGPRERLLRALGAPPGFLTACVRNARLAARAGWLGRFFWTLPIQVVGQAAWCAGEARGYGSMAR
jgi:O-antigen biosynthesis protein